MSRIALISIFLTALFSVIALGLPAASNWSGWFKVAASAAGIASLCLLVVGKRVKFDPVLR
jgi:hypothetical protein